MCSVYAFVLIFGLFCQFIVSFHFSAFPICLAATVMTMTATTKRSNDCAIFTIQISDSLCLFVFFFCSLVLFANVSVFKFILFPVWRGWCRWCTACEAIVFAQRSSVYSYYCYKYNFSFGSCVVATLAHSLRPCAMRQQ